MTKQTPTYTGLAAFALAGIALLPDSIAAVFALQVVDYQAGSGATLTDPAAALGQPNPIVGAGTGFDSILSPFNPHYEGGQLVQIGEGGSLTMQLSNYAVTGAGFPEIGIFTNVGIIDTAFPNGIAGDPVGTFGIDSAQVEVSADGTDWFDLGVVALDQPANAFANLPTPSALDTTGLIASDFGQSHALTPADYAGKNWTEIKAILAGSGGGTWLDIDGSGLAEVGWLRISVPDDGDANTNLTVEIDAISIENRALGSAIPEPSIAALLLLALPALTRRRR